MTIDSSGSLPAATGADTSSDDGSASRTSGQTLPPAYQFHTYQNYTFKKAISSAPSKYPTLHPSDAHVFVGALTFLGRNTEDVTPYWFLPFYHQQRKVPSYIATLPALPKKKNKKPAQESLMVMAVDAAAQRGKRNLLGKDYFVSPYTLSSKNVEQKSFSILGKKDLADRFFNKSALDRDIEMRWIGAVAKQIYLTGEVPKVTCSTSVIGSNMDRVFYEAPGKCLMEKFTTGKPCFKSLETKEPFRLMSVYDVLGAFAKTMDAIFKQVGERQSRMPSRHMRF